MQNFMPTFTRVKKDVPVLEYEKIKSALSVYHQFFEWFLFKYAVVAVFYKDMENKYNFSRFSF
jgi:hypothetical protein